MRRFGCGILAGIVLLMMPVCVAAQVPIALRETSVVPVIEAPVPWQAPGLWRGGGFAAGLGADSLVEFNAFRLLGGVHDGPLRRPQTGSEESQLGLQVDGLRRYGDWTVAAAVQYIRQRELNVRYNNQAHPFGGNPYLWADVISGDFVRNQLALNLDVATPRIGPLQPGIGVDYRLVNGARDNGGRPSVQYRDARLRPSLAYEVLPGHTVAAEYRYRNQREQVDIAGQAGDPTLLPLAGIRALNPVSVVAALRIIRGETQGIQGGYHGRSRIWSWTAAYGYERRQERISEGLEESSVARFSQQVHSVTGALLRVGQAHHWELTGGMQRARGIGFGRIGTVELPQVLDNFLDATIRLSLRRGHANADSARWQVAALGQWQRYQRFDLVTGTYWRTRRPAIGIEGNLRQPMGQVVALVGLQGLVGLADQAEYVRPGEPTALEQALFQREAAIFGTPLAQGRAHAGAEWNAGRNRVRILAIGQYAETTAQTFTLASGAPARSLSLELSLWY